MKIIFIIELSSMLIVTILADLDHIKKKYSACLGPSKLLDGQVRQEDVFLSRLTSIYCCASWFHSDVNTQLDFNVSWGFNGKHSKDFNSTSFTEDVSKFNQVISTLSVEALDEGTYFCKVNFENGAINTSIIKLRIHDISKFRGKPKLHKVSSLVYASIGDSKELKCSYFVGDSSLRHMSWMKVEPDRILNARKLAGVEVGKTVYESTNGTLSGTLHLVNISRAHFGTYTCVVKTMSYYVDQPITVINQVHPDIIKMQELRLKIILAVVTSLALICILVIIYLVKNRLILKFRVLMVRNEGNTPCNAYDVFIVHGPTSQKWVNEYLLLNLEKKYHLKCFLPERDLLAGEERVSAVCAAIQQSERVLIVVTRCLKSSNWCRYIAEQAIDATLSNKVKTFAVVLTELSRLSDQERDDTIFKIISHLRRIPCPSPYKIQDDNKGKTAVKNGNATEDVCFLHQSNKLTHNDHQNHTMTGPSRLLSRRKEKLFWEKILLLMPTGSLHRVEENKKNVEDI